MAYTFATDEGKTLARELLICYLNVGTSQSPDWAPIGKRVEDSSMEMDWQAERKKDILGNTYATLKKPIITQTFEPCDIDGGNEALEKIWEMAVVDQDAEGLANMDMMIAHFYVTDGATSPKNFAERYASCVLNPSSLGGEGGGNISMPLECTFGGERTVGYATKDSDTGVVTFTAATP